jgi:hypothetical protein
VGSLLSIFAIVDKSNTVSIFGKVGVLVTANLESSMSVFINQW